MTPAGKKTWIMSASHSELAQDEASCNYRRLRRASLPLMDVWNNGRTWKASRCEVKTWFKCAPFQVLPQTHWRYKVHHLSPDVPIEGSRRLERGRPANMRASVVAAICAHRRRQIAISPEIGASSRLHSKGEEQSCFHPPSFFHIAACAWLNAIFGDH